MAAKSKYYYIKERHNPQTGIYYSTLGNIPAAEAKKHEKSLCGMNVVLRFDSLEAYRNEIDELKSAGYRVL